MKRRALIIRTFTTATSAGVFTAIGWLMGTRTLSMGNGQNPCVGGGGTIIGYERVMCQWADCPNGFIGSCGFDCDEWECPNGEIRYSCWSSTSQCCTESDCPL
jgi:hypothetical protein